MKNKLMTTVIMLSVTSIQLVSAEMLLDPGFEIQMPGLITETSSPWWDDGYGYDQYWSGMYGPIVEYFGYAAEIVEVTDNHPSSDPTHVLKMDNDGYNSYAKVGQTISGGIVPGNAYYASAYYHTPMIVKDLTSSFIQLEWLNAEGTIIQIDRTDDFYVPWSRWDHRGEIFIAPDGASGVKFELVYGPKGNSLPIYIDSASFEAVAIPEPLGMILFTGGLLGLFRIRRKYVRSSSSYCITSACKNLPQQDDAAFGDYSLHKKSEVCLDFTFLV